MVMSMSDISVFIRISLEMGVRMVVENVGENESACRKISYRHVMNIIARSWPRAAYTFAVSIRLPIIGIGTSGS